MLDTKLIEKALTLTGKTMEDIETIDKQKYLEEEPFFEESLFEFSIEKFCYYLLSHEFIDTYIGSLNLNIFEFDMAKILGEAIFEYQRQDEEPLTNLLSKI